MDLYKIRGGSKEDLEAKKYNIGIGISLGNKWFSIENTHEAVTWALKHSREYVVVYVADSIHAINLEVRNRVSHERGLRIATNKSQEFLKTLKEHIARALTLDEQKRIVYATWSDIETPEYRKKVAFLYDLYESSNEFRECIKNVVRTWISKEGRIFSNEEVSKFGTYILEELPEVMGQVPIKGVVYEAYAYPFDGELTQLVEKLQTGELFPEIKRAILDTDPKVFLELH